MSKHDFPETCAAATQQDEAATPLDEASTPRADYAREVLPLRPELVSMALRYTRNPSDAEDLVQDTMLRAYGAWGRFEPGTNCRAWLFRILTNSFINGYRRSKRHHRFAHESGEDTSVALYGDVARRTQGPDRVLVDESLGDEVSAALDSLAHDYRQVVEMADLGGARYKDIARKLGLPIGTVMSRLFRARRQLEAMLADYARRDYGIRRVAA